MTSSPFSFHQGVHDYLESLQFAGVTAIPREVVSTVPVDTPAFHAGPVDGTPLNGREQMATRSIELPVALSETSRLSPGENSERPEVEMAKLPKSKRLELLQELAAKVAKCQRCSELAGTRTQTVFGEGNPTATLLFLGEAPGADEDEQGRPFVGKSGQLLTDIIQKGMGLTREDVYICNILRCRPPNNRQPTPEETASCREFLDQTLAIIQPKFICCLGAVASQNLLGTTEAIGSLRGRILQYNGSVVVCAYHPSYLLRIGPTAKAKTWDDIQLLMQQMGLPLPQKK